MGLFSNDLNSIYLNNSSNDKDHHNHPPPDPPFSINFPRRRGYGVSKGEKSYKNLRILQNSKHPIRSNLLDRSEKGRDKQSNLNKSLLVISQTNPSQPPLLAGIFPLILVQIIKEQRTQSLTKSIWKTFLLLIKTYIY